MQVLFKRTTNTHELMLNKWNVHNELPFDYEQCYRVFLQRNSILKTANIRAGKRTWVPDALQSNSLFFVKQSVMAGQHNDAINLISQLKESIASLPRKMEVLLEEAKLNMNKNNELAKSCLTQVMENNQIKDDGDLIIQSSANRIYGEILAEDFAFELDEIKVKYFDKSVQYLEKYAMLHQRQYLIPKLDDDDELSQFSQAILQEDKDSLINAKIRQASCVYDTIAKYYDRQYVFQSSYISSSKFLEKKKTFAKNSERLKILKQTCRNASEDSRRSFAILQRSNEIDRNAIENAEKEYRVASRTAA